MMAVNPRKVTISPAGGICVSWFIWRIVREVCRRQRQLLVRTAAGLSCSAEIRRPAGEDRNPDPETSRLQASSHTRSDSGGPAGSVGAGSSRDQSAPEPPPTKQPANQPTSQPANNSNRILARDEMPYHTFRPVVRMFDVEACIFDAFLGIAIGMAAT